MYRTYLTILFLQIFVAGFSQNNEVSADDTEINKAYESYFQLPRTSLYTHLNKSSYLKGENIWFQGYAYNRQTQNLDTETRNVEISIYNNNGEILDKKLFLAINGLFSGQVSIDSTFTDGEYYIKAETSYLKNFREDYSHIQRFEVLGEEQVKSSQKIKDFDLQILPEGGQMVYGCKSTLGLKLINQNGLGVKFNAELYENEKPLLDFSSNQFGHTKVDFTPKVGMNYNVKVILPGGEVINEKISDIKTEGFVLSVNNIVPKQSIFYIASNFISDEAYNSINAKLMVHQEGKHFEIPLDFSAEQREIAKAVSKSTLFNGVNTVTLIINGRPKAERLIFNRSNIIDKPDRLQITQKSKSNRDSINLSLSMPGFDKNSDLSISVLPKETVSYLKNQNISTTFLLDPFVHGYIENKTYYFKNSNRRVDYDLDLLLMIQGWSKYSWDNILNEAPTLKFKRKNGLTQNLTLNGRIPGRASKLLIYSTIFNKNQVFDLTDEKNTFKLENRYPLIGERIEASYLTDKQKFLQPNFVVGTQLDMALKDLSDSQLLPSISNLRKVKLELNRNALYSNFLKGEMLDEVVVKSKKEEKEAQNYVSSFKDNTTTVDEDFANTYPFLSDYLSTKGFIVQDVAGTFSIRTQARVSISGSNAPAIFLNGILLNDLSILAGSRTSDYKEIYVDKSGYGGGVQGAAGIIRLQQRLDALFTGDGNTETELPYAQFEVKKGFEAPKQFYMPEYSFYQTESFKQTGTIGWFSNVKISAGKSTDLQIFDTGLKDITLFIEGIAEDGTLINIDKQVNLQN